MSLVFRTWVDTSAFYVEIKDHYTHFLKKNHNTAISVVNGLQCMVSEGFEKRLMFLGMNLPCLVFPVLGLIEDINSLRS